MKNETYMLSCREARATRDEANNLNAPHNTQALAELLSAADEAVRTAAQYGGSSTYVTPHANWRPSVIELGIETMRKIYGYEASLNVTSDGTIILIRW